MGRAWLRARSACTPPLSALVCGVGVPAGVWVSAVARHSLGGCWGVCVLVRSSRVVSCTSWLEALRGGACLCARPACSPPFLAGVCCVGVRAGPGSRLCPALLDWVVGVFFFACLVLALWCRSPAVPVPGLVVPVPPSPLFRAGLLALLFFFSAWCVSACFAAPFPGGPLFLAWWSPCAPLGVLSSVPSGLGVWPPLVVLAGGLVAVGRSLAPPPLPPPFFFSFWGGVCLFLPLPSLGWRTHWPAFRVVFRVAVGGCVLLGRVPDPWVGWAMYTSGSAPLPDGLGPGSAGLAAAPGGFVWLWVRGLGLFVSLLLRDAGFNLLGGPPPLLPARGGPLCGPPCRCVACWCGAFRGVRWIVSVSPSG